MNPQIQRTIDLIKKSYDQPIIFHILHSNLVRTLRKATPSFEVTDEWSKILIYSAHPNRMQNQGMELKIQALLKRIRPPFDSPGKKLKLMVVCYYLLNRPCSMLNHILVFELVSNFLGYSEYFDGLILKILSNITLARVYSVEPNKKIKDAIIERMVELVKTTHLNDINKVKSLLCFVDCKIKPFDLSLTVIDSNFLGYRYLESFCLYAKHGSNVVFIKEILPNNISFIEGLKNFMSFDFSFSVANRIDLNRCIIEDVRLYDLIRIHFEAAYDKPGFVQGLIEFASNLTL